MLRTLRDHGINWIHYYVANVNEGDGTVEIQETFRLHKYDTPDHDAVIARMGFPTPIPAYFFNKNTVEIEKKKFQVREAA